MHETILLCPPTFFRVEYSINPWMKEGSVCQALAMSQWLDLVLAISTLGGKIQLIEPDKGFPDMVFTANAGVVHKNVFIPSNMKHDERKGESFLFSEWFMNQGYKTISVSEDKNFEGCGDVIVHKDRMIAGYGFRSDKSAHEEVSKILNLELITLKLKDPSFYHLDTCFCIVDERTAIYHPSAFEVGEIEKLKDVYDLIPVSDEDANSFICNSLKISDTLLIPVENSDLEKKLNKRGIKTRYVNVSEFLKSGGSIQCLSLRV